MESLVKQFGTLFATGVTGACCLGLPIILGALGSVGLGFLINDLILLPLFYGLLAWNLWVLYRRNQVHARRAPFWLAVVGAVLATHRACRRPPHRCGWGGRALDR